jgi:hypothetical protein
MAKYDAGCIIPVNNGLFKLKEGIHTTCPSLRVLTKIREMGGDCDPLEWMLRE